MSGGTTGEILDLRGRPSAEQMRAAHAAVERAAGGAETRILTDLEVVATYVLPAAAQRGLRCRVEPPVDGTRALELAPIGADATARGATETREREEVS